MAFNNLYVNWRCGFLFVLFLLLCTITHNAQAYPFLKAYNRHARQLDKWPVLQELLRENARLSIANNEANLISDLSRNDAWTRNFDSRVRMRNVKRNIMSGNNGAPVKAYSMKKNIQYMSPCHFKICNMGKRVAPDYTNY